jgi:hypothetical protein
MRLFATIDRFWIAAAAAIVVFVALLASGCGGGAGSPGVASVATTTRPAATTATPSGVGQGGSAGTPTPRGIGGGFQIAMNVGNTTQGRRFSACMRSHGVSNFPDPNGQGVIQINSGTGIDPRSPVFTSARSACQKLLPNGGQPTAQQQAKAQQQMLAFSACMRGHGIKDFPDPSSGGIQLHSGPGSDLNPNNPQFQAAQQACQKNLPGSLGLPSGGAKP